MDHTARMQWQSNPKPPAGQGLADLFSRRPPTAGLTSNALPGSHAPGARPAQPLAATKESFSGLVDFGSSGADRNLSLLQRQKALEEERLKQILAKQGAVSSHAISKEDEFWESLGRGKNDTTATTNGFSNPADSAAQDEDDPLAAFISGSSAKKSDHAPQSSDWQLGVAAHTGVPAARHNREPVDDVFGTAVVKPTGYTSGAPRDGLDGDQDLLDFLDKPPTTRQRPAKSIVEPTSAAVNADTSKAKRDAINELVDMGFPRSKAEEALATTKTGQDVQAAVGWLLDKAHSETKKRTSKRPDSTSRERESHQKSTAGEGDGEDLSLTPAWMRRKRSPVPPQQGASTHASEWSDKDVAQAASELGSNLLKSANTIWKTGKRTVQKAVVELQQDGNRSQPKWMAEAQRRQTEQGPLPTETQPRASRDGLEKTSQQRENRLRDTSGEAVFTEEALMLEADRSRVTQRANTPIKGKPALHEIAASLPRRRGEDSSDALRQDKLPVWSQHIPQAQGGSLNPKPQLSRSAIEEQSAQAYVSPARRKPAAGVRAAPPEVAQKEMRSENRSIPASQQQQQQQQPLTASSQRGPPPPSQHPLLARPQTNQAPVPAVIRPAAAAPAPKRVVPPVSPAALQSLHTERQRGSESFRRGDYAAAHACYTRALAALPPGGHPLAILLLCNRALANLKIGDAKAAATDADAALAAIGPSLGHGESISLGGADGGNKDMREFYAKALTRRAEALEQLEKWGDAAQAWRAVVEAGFGGASGIQARDRCEKAAAATGTGSSSGRTQGPRATTTAAAAAAATRSATIVGQKPKPAAAAAAASSKTRVAVSRSANAAAAEAVQKLRQANQAAERADEEKFVLADAVDAKLAAWKAGRQDNIRALLVSLDSVLWPECGWSKVGMHQLVAANKVKVIYMKGISKVHPDKIPVTATTEQRMISAAVFATLNHAWDKFRAENKM